MHKFGLNCLPQSTTMLNNRSLLKTVNQYICNFPDEKDCLLDLINMLKNDESLIGKSNLIGHVTASGIILYKDNILLIFHNKLQKFIQPGGHVDISDQELWKAAQREVFEETGMNTTLHPWHHAHGMIPLNIDTHVIPYNQKKNELKHLHHDFTFIFLPTDLDINLQKEEVSDMKWLPVRSIFDEKLLSNVTKKLIMLEI